MSISGTNLMDSSLLSGLGQTTGQEQAPATPPQVAETGDGSTDQTQVSKGSQQMAQLQSLSTSDPAAFKAATQKISDDLAAQAKNESDPQKAKMMENLSGKFAEAAKSGSMDSLKFGGHLHSGSGHRSGAASHAYSNGNSAGAFFSQIDGIISNALSTAGSNSTTTAAAASTAASATGGTEA